MFSTERCVNVSRKGRCELNFRFSVILDSFGWLFQLLVKIAWCFGCLVCVTAASYSRGCDALQGARTRLLESFAGDVGWAIWIGFQMGAVGSTDATYEGEATPVGETNEDARSWWVITDEQGSDIDRIETTFAILTTSVSQTRIVDVFVVRKNCKKQLHRPLIPSALCRCHGHPPRFAGNAVATKGRRRSRVSQRERIDFRCNAFSGVLAGCKIMQWCSGSAAILA